MQQLQFHDGAYCISYVHMFIVYPYPGHTMPVTHRFPSYWRKKTSSATPSEKGRYESPCVLEIPIEDTNKMEKVDRVREREKEEEGESERGTNVTWIND